MTKILIESDNKIIYQVYNRYFYLEVDCEVLLGELTMQYQNAILPIKLQDLANGEKTKLVSKVHKMYLKDTYDFEMLQIHEGKSFVENVSELVKLLNENGYKFSLKNLLDFYNRHLLIHDKQGIKSSVEVYPTTLGLQIKHNHNTTILAHTAEFVLSYLKNNFTPF